MSDQSGKRQIAATPGLVSEHAGARDRWGWIRAAVFCLLLGVICTGAMTWIGMLCIPARGVDGPFGIIPFEVGRGGVENLPVAYARGGWLLSERTVITPNASGDQIIVSSEFRFGWPFRTVRHVGRRVLEATGSVASSVRFAADPAGRHISWCGVLADVVLFSCVWFLVLHFRSARRQLRAWIASRRAWRCPECGYDLRGNEEPGCPECGWQREEVTGT